MKFKPNPKPEKGAKKSPRRINPFSAKRLKQMNEYRKVRIEFLKDHPKCQACNFQSADQIHHKKGRTGSLLVDTKYFLAVCDDCHRFIENNPLEALKMGWSVKRTWK